MAKKNWSIIIFVLWLLFIAFACLRTFTDDGISSSFNFPHRDKLAHFIFYFVGGALGYYSLFNNQSKPKIYLNKKAIIGLFIFLLLYGIIIEVLQEMYTLTREGDPLDALANGIGALAGILIAKRLFAKGKNFL